MFLLMDYKDLNSAFLSYIHPRHCFTIVLKNKQFLQEKDYYLGLKDKGQQMVKDCQPFIKELLEKKEAGKLKKINFSDWKDTFVGQFAPMGEVQ